MGCDVSEAQAAFVTTQPGTPVATALHQDDLTPPLEKDGFGVSKILVAFPVKFWYADFGVR